MEHSDYWILALSGGGARGMFTASILEQLESALEAPIASRFDLIAGTSVGGILALGVAKEIPARGLLSLFDHSKEIFDPGCNLIRWPIFHARYRSEQLKALLESESVFGDAKVGDLKHRVVIPAINYTKGAPSFFKTPHDPRLRSDWKHRLVDVAMATAAAPTYFPIYGFASQYFVDGGLVANAPGLIAVHEALQFAGQPDFRRIHVLSIGTAGGGTAMDPAIDPNMGAIFGLKRRWLPFTKGWGLRLFELTVRSQEAMSFSMLSHWLGDRHHLIDAAPQREQTDYLALDDVSEHARNTLLGQAAIAGQNFLSADLIAQLRDHQPTQPTFFYGPNITSSTYETDHGTKPE